MSIAECGQNEIPYVRMSFPQAIARYGSVYLNGERVPLQKKQAQFIELCLLRGGGWIDPYDAIEWLWPEPDWQPITANKILDVLIYRTRKLGIPVEKWNKRFRILYR